MKIIWASFNPFTLPRLLSILLLAWCTVAGAVSVDNRSVAGTGALVEFIQKPDDSFQWEIVHAREERGLQVFELSMTSQHWSPKILESNHPLWQHRLALYVPRGGQDISAILHVNGGTRYARDNSPGPEVTDELDFAKLARATGSVVVNLRDVPQQFLSLNGELPRKEDDLIARTWVAALDYPECPDCPLQFPMVKAVVRAMDAVQQLLASRNLTGAERFVITGASKRGWAAWLTAAVDKRVQAIVPIVIDVLNVQDSLDHSFDVNGGWILPLHSYLAQGQSVLPRLHTPAMGLLMSKVDPWSYRQNLTLPKFIITAAGDDFFAPDGSRTYWSGLQGHKWMRTFPNSRHYITRETKQREALTGAIARFVGYLTKGETPPELLKQKLEKSAGKGLMLSVTLSQKPDSVQLWQVTNPDRRDFRMTTLAPMGLEYVATPVEPAANMQVNIEPPAKGWKAWFLAFTYKKDGEPDFVINTPVDVVSGADLSR
ncbi:PhoPQ-activated protein PqaA family protein [Sansalvadorimonas verongulae]|uniref:PhoPQ-activated protein PqaA family protein n=1 Tax=Sansalvadorimonas verongulae TaxID=2172824 RepID=UPI0018AD2559|nr:PhoPQ-activated protein PqaA family protein [Sansalvadorimonas verongulae]